MKWLLLSFIAASSIGGDATLGESIGDKDDAGVMVPGTTPVITMTALPFTRTVTCTGSITITGTATNSPSSVTWSASPSGDSGSCTGTSSWSCAVSVSPDAAGEGVETITITATNGSGSDTDTVDVGFYVNGAHSCFLAQSVDGSYNSTLANNDPIATWDNLGSSGLDVTQGTAGSRPTYKTAVVGGQPVVRLDGGDAMLAATASDWIFLHNGVSASIDVTASLTNTGSNVFVATSAGTSLSTGIGFRTHTNAVESVFLSNGASLVINSSSAINIFTINTFNNFTITLAATDTPDLTGYVNGSSALTATAASFSSGNPAGAMQVGQSTGGGSIMTGDLFKILIYSSVLTSTQRQINKAVDEWALGATFPVTP
jgi:hypothetical protein